MIAIYKALQYILDQLVPVAHLYSWPARRSDSDR